jgi:hypothetical protein
MVPDWGDEVNSGTGELYQPARLHRLAGRCDNLICRSQQYPPVRDYEFGYWIHRFFIFKSENYILQGHHVKPLLY